MTYYADQVAASQKRIADALSGKRLRDSIRQLQERSKITNSLKPLQARGALTSKKKIGKRAVADNLSAELRELTSSDGLFVLRYYHLLGVI